ncbi:MAG: winged helix-turn-helix transcriptional regulator [Candidatus Heimdallarchaeota archaeon]|nr:winged helix-turn-helix transcriptional regulator [Candidatus Heimdallarchaeota archaeon]MDH5646338.1 winged helix-turn-helix transcriptional regulator [Candidatus Heimdallarchaeota archaeon]
MILKFLYLEIFNSIRHIMVLLNFTKEEIEDFEQRIEYMNKLIQVFRWDSCNKIMIHLNINGKMKTSNLKDKLNLKGEKSLFRSLKALSDAGLIKKERNHEEPRNAYYSVNNRISDPSFDTKFVEYLIIKNKYDLISSYLSFANYSSLGFIKMITEIISDYIEENKSAYIGQSYIENTFFLQNIFNLRNHKEVKSKLSKFYLDVLNPYFTQNQPDEDQSMDNPAAIFIAFMPLNSTNYKENKTI